MALPRVLFAGDSNLKFVPWFVPEADRGRLKIVTVSGASVVKDVTNFRGYLEEAARNFRPEELYLHLGSNDVSRKSSPRRVYWELRQLIDDVREIVPYVHVKLCCVLPRSRSTYKDERWNRFVLPELQNGVFVMNCVLQDLCEEQDFEYVEYNPELHHFGADGLHVRPAGAKHLLSTILGKVKSKCLAPVTTAPCFQKTVPLDFDAWPALPSNSHVKQPVYVEPTWNSVVLTPKKNKEEPVTMPYDRVPCNVSFGWDDSDEKQAQRSTLLTPANDIKTTNQRQQYHYEAVVDEWKEQDHPGKLCSLKEMQSKGMMRLDIFGVEAYVKPSSFGIKTGLCGGSKKGKKTAANPGKTKRVNVNGAREYLRRICTSSNERNLKPDGPYGDICEIMAGLSNSKMNRKRLQTLWFRLKKSSVDEETTDKQTKGKSCITNTRSKSKISKVSLNRGLVSNDSFDIPKKDIEYVAIGKVLRDIVKSDSGFDFGESGPYALTCNILGWEISTSNKLFLHRIWKENRGNVRDAASFHLDVKQLEVSKVKKRRHFTGKNTVEREEEITGNDNLASEIDKNYKTSGKTNIWAFPDKEYENTFLKKNEPDVLLQSTENAQFTWPNMQTYIKDKTNTVGNDIPNFHERNCSSSNCCFENYCQENNEPDNHQLNETRNQKASTNAKGFIPSKNGYDHIKSKSHEDQNLRQENKNASKKRKKLSIKEDTKEQQSDESNNLMQGNDKITMKRKRPVTTENTKIHHKFIIEKCYKNKDNLKTQCKLIKEKENDTTDDENVHDRKAKEKKQNPTHDENNTTVNHCAGNQNEEQVVDEIINEHQEQKIKEQNLNLNRDKKTEGNGNENKEQVIIQNVEIIHDNKKRKTKENNPKLSQEEDHSFVNHNVANEIKVQLTTVDKENINDDDEIKENEDKNVNLTGNKNKINVAENVSVESNCKEIGKRVNDENIHKHMERQTKEKDQNLNMDENKANPDHYVSNENKDPESTKLDKTETFYSLDSDGDIPFNQTIDIQEKVKKVIQENTEAKEKQGCIEDECSSDNETNRSISFVQHKFDEQCWDEQIRKKETKSIFNMLEIFFSDNDSNENSTHIELKSLYKKTKLQIASFKRFSDKNIDLEKEYKIKEELFMQNLLFLDNLKSLPVHKYIKKSLVYLNNSALTALDHLYKKTKNKAAITEACEENNANKSQDRDKVNTTPVQDAQCLSKSESNISCDQPNEPLSRETISSILEVEIPDRYFTKAIPELASFTICENDMKNLLLNRTERSFKRDSWQSLFLQKIKESNPYCCFQITRSRLSTATKRSRKSGSPFFLVEAKCTFVDCSIKLKLEMHDKSRVNIFYTGDLKHDINEIRYRPIKGKDRDHLKSQFHGGIKPMAHYLDRLQQLPTEYLVSGNRDGLGKNSRVFAQISAESRQGGRMDDSVFQSLQELKEEMNKKVEGGFIQKICASPCYVLYWSKYGIDLYNERAKKDALYWDATGSVVRKQEDGKQFLYYELAIRNPIKGKMGIPLTAMITNDQSLPTILDWLRCFRQAEKQKFGHNSKKIVSFPKLIVSDQAMVFILAALKEFNGESLDDFLCRAWNIVHGKAHVDDTCKTIVHLCASHFMHTAKLHLKKKEIGGHKLKMFLYMIGLLMNCSSIHDAQELLGDIYITLGSTTIHNENQKLYDRLIRKINNFNCIADNEIIESIDEIQEKSESLNPGRFTEEEFQILGSTSPFKDWNFNILSKTQKMIIDMTEIKQTDLFVNPLHSPAFSDYLNKRLMPLFPLWGSSLLGDLTRYNENYHPLMKKDNGCLFNSIDNMGKTNSTIENRFRILKDICLGGRTQHRLDEFSERLKISTIGIQKLVALDCLKYPSFIKSPSKRETKMPKRKKVVSFSKKYKKQKTLVHEQWNKARPQSENLKSNIGKYQQAPKEEIKLKQTPVKRKCDEDFNFDDSVSPIKTRRNNKNTNFDRNNKLREDDLKIGVQTKTNSSQFCSLSNFGNSCWLNSVLQAVAQSQMSSRVLESNDLCIDLTGTELSNSEIAIHDIIQVWKYMKDPKFFGTHVPDKILRSAYRSVVAAIPGFSFRQQQDAHEFNSNIIADMANSLTDNTLEYHFTEECSHCKKARIRETNVGQSIVLDIEGINNVSVQTLINNFLFRDSFIRKCNSCKNETEHTIKQKNITKFPGTLMILIRRYKVQYLGKQNIVPKKLHNNIHVSSQLCLTDEKDFQVNYELKSTVCHHGNSTSAGHYNAVIRHNDDYICCDDKTISLVDSDYTLSTAYLVLYDRVDPSLPVYVKPFINCWRLTKGITEVLKVMKPNPLIKGKTNLLDDIHKNGMTDKVDATIKKFFSFDLVINKTSEVDFYSNFIKYLIQTDKCSEILFRDNFNVSTNHIRLCQHCGLVDTQFQNCLSLSVKEFSTKSVHNCLSVLQGERVLRMCRCGSKPDVFIMSLPSTLVINVEDCRNLGYEDIQTLSISDELKEVYPIGSRKYHLKSIYGHKNGHFLSCIKTDLLLIPMLNGKELYSFTEFGNIILFFDRENFKYDHEKELVHMLKKNGLPEYPFLKIPKQKIVDIKHKKESYLFGIKISRDFFPTLLDTSAWLSSDHINVYLSLLAKESLFKVYPVNSVWYSQRMLKDSDPQKIQWVFHETESKLKWFDFDFILIPVNENGSHWTIVIIEIKKKQIIYCDSLSLGENASIICHQVWRYMCYEALLHSGLVLKKNEWSILHYNNFHGFPTQTDGSSCGVYVCTVAKAIIFQHRLPKEPNLLNFRNCIAHEINSSSLYI